MKRNYYGKLSAAVYDISKPPGTSIDGDVEFYTNELLPKEGLVLEAGVGNGRMAIPLLRKGIDVIGLDNSTDMLELYKMNLEKYNMTSKIIHGELKNFKTDLQFETIIMPNGSLCLLDKQEAIETLNNFKKFLKADGLIYIDLIFPTSFFPGKVFNYDVRFNEIDVIQITNKSISMDWVKQETYSELHYNFKEEQEIQPFRLVWYGVEEFKVILEKLGFKNIRWIQNYNTKILNLKNITFIFGK